MTTASPACLSVLSRAQAKVGREATRPWGALSAFIVALAASLSGFFLPSKVDEKRRRLLYGIAFAGLLGIGLKLSFILPAVIELLDGREWILFVESNVVYPSAILFFAAASRLVPEPRSRRAIVLLQALLFGLLISQSLWTLQVPDCYVRGDGEWSGGVCLQSTDYTCVASSVATIARFHGDLTVTEALAAERTMTIPGRGVSAYGAAIALREFLPGKVVRVQATKVRELEGLPMPCMASLKLTFWVDHMVTVLEAHSDHVVLGDPLMGRVRMSHAELEARWLGRTITIEEAR